MSLMVSHHHSKTHALPPASCSQVFQVDPEGRESVQAMCTKGRGLLAAGSLGVLYFFEPPDAEARRWEGATPVQTPWCFTPYNIALPVNRLGSM